MLMTVSAKTTFGLKNLFTEVDGDHATDLNESLNETSALIKPKFDNIIVLKSNEQESVSLQLAYTSFRIDMRFYEDQVDRVFLIRSTKGEKNLKKIDNYDEMKQLHSKAGQMKQILQKRLDRAQEQELTNTVEFEYASHKFAQLTQIEQQLQSKIDGYHCISNFIKALLFLFSVAAIASVVNLMLIDKPIP